MVQLLVCFEMRICGEKFDLNITEGTKSSDKSIFVFI